MNTSRRLYSKPDTLLALYRWMEEFEKKYRCKPAVEEIASAFQISTSVVRYYQERMVELGMGFQPKLIREKTGGEITPSRSFILLPLEQANEAVKSLL